VTHRIHIFGASGSGATTLAKALAEVISVPHYDTDNFFWEITDPPFQSARKRTERQRLLRQALTQNESWTLSGSLCGWGDFAIPMFNCVVYLWLPSDVRMKRLRKREIERYGPDIENRNHPSHKHHKAILEWAAAYDSGGLDMRSKSSHEKWIHALPYPVVRIEGSRRINENLKIILNEIFPGNALEKGWKQPDST